MENYILFIIYYLASLLTNILATLIYFRLIPKTKPDSLRLLIYILWILIGIFFPLVIIIKSVDLLELYKLEKWLSIFIFVFVYTVWLMPSAILAVKNRKKLLVQVIVKDNL